MISVVIPACNESSKIQSVLSKIPRSYEIIVVDDNSSDSTVQISKKYARVISNQKNLGYDQSLKKGILASSGDIIITMDADGEHDPKDIPRFLSALQTHYLVIGERSNLPRLTEHLMAWLVRRVVPNIKDPANGFRAFHRSLIQSISLDNLSYGCNLLIRAHRQGFKIKTIPTKINRRPDSRHHFSTILKSLIPIFKEIFS
ncbi:MAG: glycosyltransferase family 2 protein [Promethearchaeota archaeon]